MPGSMELGVVRAFDGATRKAAVRLLGGLQTYLTAVAVAAHVSAADMTVGRECVVVFVEEHEPDSATVVAVLGSPVGDGGGGGGAGLAITFALVLGGD